MVIIPEYTSQISNRLINHSPFHFSPHLCMVVQLLKIKILKKWYKSPKLGEPKQKNVWALIRVKNILHSLYSEYEEPISLNERR